MGLVGKTKEVSLDTIRRANLLHVNRARTKTSTLLLAALRNVCRYIPELAEYPTDRISFRLGPSESSHPRYWAVATEDVWFTFESDPPAKLGVMVEPNQKDRDAGEFGSFTSSAPRTPGTYLINLFWFCDLDWARKAKAAFIVITCCLLAFGLLIAFGMTIDYLTSEHEVSPQK